MNMYVMTTLLSDMKPWSYEWNLKEKPMTKINLERYQDTLALGADPRKDGETGPSKALAIIDLVNRQDIFTPILQRDQLLEGEFGLTVTYKQVGEQECSRLTMFIYPGLLSLLKVGGLNIGLLKGKKDLNGVEDLAKFFSGARKGLLSQGYTRHVEQFVEVESLYKLCQTLLKNKAGLSFTDWDENSIREGSRIGRFDIQ